MGGSGAGGTSTGGGGGGGTCSGGTSHNISLCKILLLHTIIFDMSI